MIEKGKCPLCGKDNHCAALLDVDPSTCWCMTKKIPKGLLDTVDEKIRRQSCICQACVDAYKEKEGR